MSASCGCLGMRMPRFSALRAPHLAGAVHAPILENGATIQLEGDPVRGYIARRKSGGAVIGELSLRPFAMARFEAKGNVEPSERRELIALVRRIAPDRRRLLWCGEDRLPRSLPTGGPPAPTPPLSPILAALGISLALCRERGLPAYAEPRRLHWIGDDRWGRRHWLVPAAAKAFLAMRAAALRAGVRLEIVSSFRSVAYQAALFRSKLARGLPLATILAVNAPPGFSEHHSGRALDLSTPGCPPAETCFEETAAFRWLQENAGLFGFRMSYPRGNPYGFVYEPWHWCWSSGP